MMFLVVVESDYLFFSTFLVSFYRLPSPLTPSPPFVCPVSL